MKPLGKPMVHAMMANRKYITPEDVAAAIANGGTRSTVYGAVLEAIARKNAEDPSACAHVALKAPKKSTDSVSKTEEKKT